MKFYYLIILLALTSCHSDHILRPVRNARVTDGVIDVVVSGSGVGVGINETGFLVVLPFLEDWEFVSDTDALFKGFSPNTNTFASVNVIPNMTGLKPEEYLKKEFADSIKQGWIYKSNYDCSKIIKPNKNNNDIVQQIICAFPYPNKRLIILKVISDKDNIYDYGQFTEGHFNGLAK